MTRKIGTLGQLLQQALVKAGNESSNGVAVQSASEPETGGMQAVMAMAEPQALVSRTKRVVVFKKRRLPAPAAPAAPQAAVVAPSAKAPPRSAPVAAAPEPPVRPKPDYVLTIRAGAAVKWLPMGSMQVPLMTGHVLAGRALQIAQNPQDDAELCIGLDFGTSSVKAVVTDKVTNVSYAVPFREAEGLASYLLPCSLERDGVVVRDLKLALLEDIHSDERMADVVAFLAVVIRHIRGWLFAVHGTTYARSNIIWKLCLGLPVASMKERAVVDAYRRLGFAAWIAAGCDAEALSEDVVRSCLDRVGGMNLDSDAAIDEAEVELALAPEVAAQIHGFVSSGAYDPQGQNTYLMVDVGAGTVDASVFRIERQGGRDRFIAYSATVERNGVMCLHRARMHWWADALRARKASRKELQDWVEQSCLLTDTELPLPDQLTGYFTGVSVTFQDRSHDPDQRFYSAIHLQVGNKTYARLKLENILPDGQLKDMPMILCGGGRRLKFYSRLEESMAASSGYSWFSTRPFRMKLPEHLLAPGVKQTDYDRLSVAYGLSRLSLREVVTEVPPMFQ